MLYFKADEAAMAIALEGWYDGMGFPYGSARSLPSALPLDTTLPEPRWDVSFAPGKRAPKDGIYEQVDENGHIVWCTSSRAWNQSSRNRLNMVHWQGRTRPLLSSGVFSGKTPATKTAPFPKKKSFIPRQSNLSRSTNHPAKTCTCAATPTNPAPDMAIGSRLLKLAAAATSKPAN